MKKQSVRWALPIWLGLGAIAGAQNAQPAPAAVQGIKGVKEDAVSTVKHVETGNAAPTGGVTTGAKNDAQAVNKVNGVETINGVKQDGRAVVPPPPPVAPPPPKVNGVETINGVKEDGRTVITPPPPVAPPPPKVNGVETINGVKEEGHTVVVPPPPPPPAVHQAVGTAATIQAVKGVTGLNTAKIQNLEAALNLKHGGNTPPGTGAENGGKGKAAAAGLLAAPLEKPDAKAPKADGRGGFQEFEKLQVNGS